MITETFQKVTLSGISQTLAQLGVALPEDIVAIVVLPLGSVAMAFGSATSSTAVPVASAGINFPIDNFHAAQLQFAGASMTLAIQSGVPPLSSLVSSVGWYRVSDLANLLGVPTFRLEAILGGGGTDRIQGGAFLAAIAEMGGPGSLDYVNRSGMTLATAEAFQAISGGFIVSEMSVGKPFRF